MPAKRAAALSIALALLGLGLAITIASVHSQLAGTVGHASFCNVNETVNCDVVLSSEYAYFLAVPVAWWAIVAYLVIAALAGLAGWAGRASQRRQAATGLFAAAIGGIVYSAFLAYVSFFMLYTVCLLCSGLYVVNLGLLVTSSILFATARAAAREQETWQGRTRLITGGAIAAAVMLIGLVAWKASDGGQSALTPDPAFADWYLKLPVVTVGSSGGHAKGDQTARVTIVEFSDFQCGHCARAYRSLKSVLPRFPKDVQVRFHHFPLDSSCNPSMKQSFHKYACLAAMAAECAGGQGKFWEYHDLLFENQSALDRDSLLDYAERVGLDRAQFLSCLESEAPRQAIARDVADGMRLNIESTPTFFLNGRQLPGAREAADLERAIRLERSAHTTGAS